jgi:uncharacterized membrane protein
MESTAIALVLCSAVSHALWNYFAKTGNDKGGFMFLMNITSHFTVLPVYLLLLKDWWLPLEVIPILIFSGLAEAIYFFSLAKAYESGDLSVVYPVARSSPVFVAVFASIFFLEPLSSWGIAGILIVLIGVYVIYLPELSISQALHPFRNLAGKATLFAFMAALGTTAYTLLDRVGVTHVDPLLYSFWLEVSVTIFLVPILLIDGVDSIKGEWKNGWKRISISGFLMRGGYILILIAMKLASVAYILAIRQFSVVIGALLGVFFLKEGYGSQRVVGSLIIFIGVYFLVILA